MDRSTPVARIVGYVPRETGEDPVLADLIARGKARGPLRDADWEGLDGMPGPRFEGNELLEALLANREEDR